MLHIFTRRVAGIADSIERELFRIERENRVLSSLINGLIAGTAVGIVAWFVTHLREGDLLLFACLGSSAASVVFAPLAKTNSLRTIILAYSLSAGVCLLMDRMRSQWDLSLAIECFLAVSVSVSVMRLLDSLHPAAVGSAMAFMIFQRDAQSLLLLILAILGLLTVVKVLAYVYLQELKFKYFSREFRHDYYGREVTLTVVDEPTQELLEQEVSDGG